jgi:hypothetical protein
MECSVALRHSLLRRNDNLGGIHCRINKEGQSASLILLLQLLENSRDEGKLFISLILLGDAEEKYGLAIKLTLQD